MSNNFEVDVLANVGIPKNLVKSNMWNIYYLFLHIASCTNKSDYLFIVFYTDNNLTCPNSNIL